METVRQATHFLDDMTKMHIDAIKDKKLVVSEMKDEQDFLEEQIMRNRVIRMRG